MNQEKSGLNEEAYFFDTYALIELFQGSEPYAQYKKAKVMTNILNLYELYFNLRKERSKEEIFSFFIEVNRMCIEVKPQWIIEASEFKLKMSKRELSYADCLGYTMAFRLGVKFLTGDKEFKNLPNVEFVK